MLNSNLFADWAAAHAYRGRAVVLGPGSDNLEARLAVECRSRVPRPAPVIARCRGSPRPYAHRPASTPT